MRVSPEVEIAFSLATREAARRRHEFVTVEHLLYALLFDEETVVVVRHAGGDPMALKKKLEKLPSTKILRCCPTRPRTSPSLSLGFQRVVGRAAVHVQSAGKQELKGGNVLVALFAERECPAVAMLNELGVSRFDVVNYISHGISKSGEDEMPRPDESNGARDERQGEDGEAPPAKDPLAAYTTNLNKGEAQEGRIDPLIGRDNESGARFKSLARRRKNNPLLIGEAGVGKTAVVEGPRAGTSSAATRRRPSRTRPSMRSTWGRCSPAPSSGATSRTASRPCSRRSRSSPARSSSSTSCTRSSAPARDERRHDGRVESVEARACFGASALHLARRRFRSTAATSSATAPSLAAFSASRSPSRRSTRPRRSSWA